MSKVLIPGGYVSIAGGIPSIHYYQTDHLGNIRQVLSSDGVLQEQNDYYAFGMRQLRGDYPLLASNKYKYNGKELETFNNFETLDYGARFYDPSLGRWQSVDPKAELAPDWTPYRAFFNNPLRYIDPDGQFEGDFYDREGNYLGNDGVDDGKIYLLNDGMRPKLENKTVNWGGELSKVHSNDLKNKSSEVGGLIIQNRIEDGSDFTISEFKTIGGDKNVTGFMLEPAGPSTSTPNQDKRISEDVYDIENYSSKKYPDNFLLSNKDVSKDRKILYHSGNNGGNTEGCNMPGTTKDSKAGTVGGSNPKMQELRTFIKSKGAENVKTIINNKIPEKK